MAETEIGTSHALRVQVWDEKLYRDSVKESYFQQNGFIGNGPEYLVHRKSELTKGQGDKMTFGIRYRLTGDGVVDDEILEGNEEDLATANFDVELHQYRHAVKDKGALHRQRASFNMDGEARTAIKDWGTEKIDKLFFDAIFAARSKVFYRTAASPSISAGTEATAKAALTAANGKLTLDMITAIRRWAKTGGNRAYVPIRPVKIGGKKYYVLLISEDSAYDLETSSDWKTAQQYARERSGDNPLFQGALGVWSGVIIHSHENVPTADDAGASSNVHWSKAVLLGAQALCYAEGKRPELIEESKDYKNKHCYAWDIMMGTEMPIFDSKEYGSIGMYVAATDISGL
jgi:N4-gp56 family major capsid protein